MRRHFRGGFPPLLVRVFAHCFTLLIGVASGTIPPVLAQSPPKQMRLHVERSLTAPLEYWFEIHGTRLSESKPLLRPTDDNAVLLDTSPAASHPEAYLAIHDTQRNKIAHLTLPAPISGTSRTFDEWVRDAIRKDPQLFAALLAFVRRQQTRHTTSAPDVSAAPIAIPPSSTDSLAAIISEFSAAPGAMPAATNSNHAVAVVSTPRERPQAAISTTGTARLVGVAGSYAGTDFLLGDPVVRLGRDATCALTFLKDGSVSQCHASLHFVDGEYTLMDEGSSNGTFVNGARLAANSPRTLHPGDEVQIGASRFRFEV